VDSHSLRVHAQHKQISLNLKEAPIIKIGSIGREQEENENGVFEKRFQHKQKGGDKFIKAEAIK
jgi:hypothetical protein